MACQNGWLDLAKEALSSFGVTNWTVIDKDIDCGESEDAGGHGEDDDDKDSKTNDSFSEDEEDSERSSDDGDGDSKGGVRGTRCGVHPQDLTPSWIYKIGVPCYAAYVQAYHAGMHPTNRAEIRWNMVAQFFVMPTSA